MKAKKKIPTRAVAHKKTLQNLRLMPGKQKNRNAM